jgi:hypothetical protein
MRPEVTIEAGNHAEVNYLVRALSTFTPAHVISSTSVFVPTAFDLTFTFTPSEGGVPIVNTSTAAKAAPIANTITCTIPLQTTFFANSPQHQRSFAPLMTGFAQLGRPGGCWHE